MGIVGFGTMVRHDMKKEDKIIRKEKSIPGKYRLVLLTSLVSEVLKSIIEDKIVEFLAENEFINDTQHGFRKIALV